ncbi:MAG TPA: EAL domain-containing protein [Thermoanaerobaculia bacterium]|nr:EAL domain-containing protein [Thermoanaerobaculia bacterium]
MTPRAMLEVLLAPGAIRMEFQPIVTVTNDGVSLYALEALTRGPRGTSMESPNVLFEYARRKGEETRVDLLCIAEAFEAARTLPGLPVISINIHGSTLSSVPHFADTFLESAISHGIAPQRLMLEIVEHRAPWAIDRLQLTIAQLREAGVRIALDDLGVGASNYHLFVDCRPDHIKVDRYLVKNCHRDAYRIAVLRSIVALGNACGAIPIAEGIEFHEDLMTVRDLGIVHMQGWMFSKSLPPAEIAESRFLNDMKRTDDHEEKSTARR